MTRRTSMIRVLLVDDHKIVRDGLRSILEPSVDHPLGQESQLVGEHSPLAGEHSLKDSIRVVGEAATGKEAIAFLERQPANPSGEGQSGEGPSVDVVLMDISMPSESDESPMDGLQATSYIKAHFPGVKVLLLTMLDKEQFILEASQVGAHGYVLKTAGDKEIQHAVRTVHEGEEYFSADVAKILIRRLLSTAPEQRTNPTPDSQAAAQSAVTQSAASQAPDSAPLPAGITARELEVLQLIAEGYTTADISERLFTSKRTVETHRQNLLTKTQCNNTAALIRFAVRQGLVQ